MQMNKNAYRSIIRGAIIISLIMCFFFLGKVMASSAAGVIPVAYYREVQLTNGVPEGWSLVKKAGTPQITLVKVGENYAFHLKSDGRSGFGIERALNLDIREYRYLNWTWKAVRLPTGGDIRRPSVDDQVMQIYIAMAPTGFPSKLYTPVLAYLWDNEAPKGTVVKGSLPGTRYIRYLVVRNGTDDREQWYKEKRNIYEDYRTLFRDVKNGEPVGPTQGLRIYINSQHTHSYAEGYIGDIYFSQN